MMRETMRLQVVRLSTHSSGFQLSRQEGKRGFWRRYAKLMSWAGRQLRAAPATWAAQARPCRPDGGKQLFDTGAFQARVGDPLRRLGGGDVLRIGQGVDLAQRILDGA